MKEVTNIEGQVFFATNVSEITGFSNEGKYAIVAASNDALALIESGLNFSASGLNQLIVIGDNTSDVLSKLIGVDVFVIAADSWQQAIKLSAQSTDLNNQVICIENDQVQNLGQLIESTLK